MTTPLITVDSDEILVALAADRLAAGIRAALDQNGRCSLALSGGSTPGPVYTRLASLPDIDWSQVIILLADERCVPPSHEESNARLIAETFLAHLPARPLRFLVPDMRLQPGEAADSYGRDIEEALDVHPLDLCVLGMGEDGHTASLFPPLTEMALSPLTAIHTTQDDFPIMNRISLTLPMLTSARQTLILLSGQNKKEVWEMMEASAEGPERWPLKAVLAAGKATVITRW